VPNLWRSLFALERRLSTLAEKRFWWPVAANLWWLLFALERRRSPMAEKRFWRPVAANLWRSPMVAWQGRRAADTSGLLAPLAAEAANLWLSAVAIKRQGTD
jgi:hypothetical protein